MLVVERADLAQMRSYLYQADGVLIAALKACEGKTLRNLRSATLSAQRPDWRSTSCSTPASVEATW